MDITGLTPRDRLQLIYELAFFPPRLTEFWRAIRKNELTDRDRIAALIESALLLHQALPESGYASTRALKRLAYYQASSKSYVPETFLRNIAKKMGLSITMKQDRVPGGMIRDIGLPEFCRKIESSK